MEPYIWSGYNVIA